MVLPGFNTDFKYQGDTYHAQTEDNGVNNPVVVTLLYYKGAILASKKTPYRDLLEREDWQKDLMALMKNQHRDIMRDLLAGRLQGRSAAPAPAAPAEAAPSPAAEAPAAQAPAAVADPEPAPPPRRVAPSPSRAKPPAAPRSLDEEIFHYLAEHAAAAGAAGH